MRRQLVKISYKFKPDGNKRIGSFLFLLYLHQEGMALLVAESLPANKDLLIRLIVNLLLET